MKFDVYSLMEQKKGSDQVSGPMSPMLFAEEAMEQLGYPYNRLARVSFDDPEINNQYERGEGLTGYDTLLVAAQGKEHIRFVIMLIDMGAGGCPVGFWNHSEPDVFTMTEVYQNIKFEKRLSNASILKIIKSAVEQERFDIKVIE